MKTTTLTVNTKTLLGDLQTPIGIYLKVRDLYENSVLLESSDYNSASNSNSYVAFSPIASYRVKNKLITMQYPDGTKEEIQVADKNSVSDSFNAFINSFSIAAEQKKAGVNGFFGYTSYDAVKYFEDVGVFREWSYLKSDPAPRSPICPECLLENRFSRMKKFFDDRDKTIYYKCINHRCDIDVAPTDQKKLMELLGDK